MAKRYLINIFLLIAVLCGFSSCEEDPYYDPRKSPMIYVIMYGQIGLS